MGRLDVTIISAQGLMIRDGYGTTDPYIKVRWGNQKFKTRVLKRTYNPVWNQAFTLNLLQGQMNQPLELQIWDHNAFADDYIGRTFIPITGLIHGQTVESWHSVYEGSGSIYVRLHMHAGPAVAQPHILLAPATDILGNPALVPETCVSKGYPMITGTPMTGIMSAPIMGLAPQPNGRRKALLIGINYFSTPAPLRGCINDVKKMAGLMVQHGFGTDPSSLLILTDDSLDPRHQPTRNNIVNAMAWLTANAHPGDILFFHYSGHGAQQVDPNGLEVDGMNETILPVDFRTAGMISDDEMFNLLVRPLPAGAKLTAVMDCCHSGTGLDLPYNWTPMGWIPDASPCHSLGDVTLFSACADEQTSADVSTQMLSGGAMTHAFVSAMYANPTHTYPSLMDALYRIMQANGYRQRPQLTSSQEFPLSKMFSLTEITPNSNTTVGRLMPKIPRQRNNFFPSAFARMIAGTPGNKVNYNTHGHFGGHMMPYSANGINGMTTYDNRTLVLA